MVVRVVVEIADDRLDGLKTWGISQNRTEAEGG
jgi:hypothetical protein